MYTCIYVTFTQHITNTGLIDLAPDKYVHVYAYVDIFV